MSRGRSSHRKRCHIAGLAVSGLALATAILLFGFYRNAPAVQTKTESVAKRATTTGASEDSAPPAPVAKAPIAPRSSVGEPFQPAEVIDNLDCVMAAGGPENDTAVVLLPREEGANPAEGHRFAVLDGDGHLFGDVLPFTPNHKRLGRRADGSVVVGFGDLRANSKQFRPPDTPEPVRIYVDGQIVYSTDKADDFRIAADGSSFFVHELLPGGMSRLVVRDLDSGALEHIEMGQALKPRNEYEGAYGMWYTRDFREVQVAPLHLDRASGTYRFYRVGGAKAARCAKFAWVRAQRATLRSPPRPVCKCPKHTALGSHRVRSRTSRTAWRLAT